MEKLIKAQKSMVVSNPDSMFSYFGWPSIARLDDGTLAVVCSGFRLRHICPFGKAVICYSRDEGRTWTRPAPVIDTILDDRDGGITAFGNGRCIVTSFNNTLAQQRRWQAKEQNPFILSYIEKAEACGREADYLGSTYKISEDGGYTFGPLMRSPVTAPHGPIRMNDGSLLYVGRRFSATDSFDDGSTPYIQACRMNENDEFVPVSSIENIYSPQGELLASCEPHAVQLRDGRIVVHIRVQGAGYFTLFQSVSEDGGRSFSKPEQLLDTKGGSPAHLLEHPGGTLISVYGYRNEPYGVRAMFSRDGGRTWDKDYTLYAEGLSADIGYPASVVLKDGRILTVFYENTGSGAVISSLVWELPQA